MLKEAQNLVEKANELKDFAVKMMFELGAEDILANNEALDLLRKTYQLMDASTELVLEQAKLMDEIDRKLERLLKKAEA